MVATVSALAAGQEAYHLSLAREGYYVEGGEPPGRWHGLGARALGLHGTVHPDALRSLFRGVAADGATPLVQNAGSNCRQPAWDVCYSAPKDVSVLWALAEPRARHVIQHCHDEAVRDSLNFLEAHAAWSRRGAGGVEREQAGLVVATFEHGTSRALDPQLHTHCLVLNVGVRADGTTGAIESHPLYRHKMAAGALYRATLAARLEERLGLACERRANWFGIRGVPEEVVERFSTRRRQVEAALAARGLAGPEAAAVATLDTRPAKQTLPRQELFALWAKAEPGFGPAQIRGLIGPPIDRDPKQELRAALEAAVARLTDRQSHFGLADLVRHAMEEAPGRGLDAASVLRGVESAIREVLVGLGRSRGEERFTTKEMLEVEARLLDQVERSRTTRDHVVPAPSATEVLAQRPQLTNEQAAAVRHVSERPGAVQVLSGLAGTGKTSVLGCARDVWERHGLVVLGAALSGKAALGLQEGSGIPSATIHRTLLDIGRGRLTITPGTVLVVDEAGMVGTRQMERLVEAVVTEGRGKLVLVGDAKQLQPVEAGGPFAAIAGRLGQAELTHITRQRSAWARRAVRDLAFGNSALALEAFAERGLLVVADDNDLARASLLGDWHRLGGVTRPKDHLILAGTNAEVRLLNRLAQAERLGQGLLGAESVLVGAERFHAGDRILFTRNWGPLGVKNGQLGEVVGVDPAERALSVRLDGGRVVLVAASEYEHLRLGYAVTVYKSQGMTVENAYALVGGPSCDRELTYVQASRSRGETRLYTDRREAGDGLAQLVRRAGQSHQKGLAADVLAGGPNTEPAIGRGFTPGRS